MKSVDLLVEQVKRDGFCVIKNAIKVEHLDLIYKKMLDDLPKLLSKSEDKLYGLIKTKNNLQHSPPPLPEYVFPDIVGNTTVDEISRNILGENYFNDLYSGNTNMPGSLMQPLHMDTEPLWETEYVTHPAVSLVVNIPLIDFTEANGATELWPGTQSLHEGKFPNDEVINQRRLMKPPIRAILQKGDILVRDVRLWHRGMPNHTGKVRIMLAMLHQKKWLAKGKPVPFHHGCKSILQNVKTEHHAKFLEEPFDYLEDPLEGFMI